MSVSEDGACPMSQRAQEVSRLFIQTMEREGLDNVLGKIREIWWPSYLERFLAEGVGPTLDSLDSCMDRGRALFERKAEEYAFSRHNVKTQEFEQARSQFIKSNTGKMFEKFVGLALAHALMQADSNYCVAPFSAPFLRHCKGIGRKDFEVDARLGAASFTTRVDGDLFAFNPDHPEGEIHLISMKSTLKDRFHNVAFWNLLRLGAISNVESSLVARNEQLLRRLRYVAVCSDLAKHQKDFGTDTGARNLLCFDAALLDGAYVTAAAAKGLGKSKNHFGPERDRAFYPLSSYYDLLAKKGD